MRKKVVSNIEAFFALLRAGLWEKRVRLSPFSPIDFVALYKLAEEQSVVGLIAAGLEYIEDVSLEKQQIIPFMKQVLSLEHRNSSMNIFIGKLFDRLQAAEIQALLVKGQGVAQCYERPLLRSAGDIDLLLDADSYERAKLSLPSLASSVDIEDDDKKHIGMKIDSWVVELHGTLHCSLSGFHNEQIDFIQEEAFKHKDFRVWHNGDTRSFFPVRIVTLFSFLFIFYSIISAVELAFANFATGVDCCGHTVNQSTVLC